MSHGGGGGFGGGHGGDGMSSHGGSFGGHSDSWGHHADSGFIGHANHHGLTPHSGDGLNFSLHNFLFGQDGIVHIIADALGFTGHHGVHHAPPSGDANDTFNNPMVVPQSRFSISPRAAQSLLVLGLVLSTLIIWPCVLYWTKQFDASNAPRAYARVNEPVQPLNYPVQPPINNPVNNPVNSAYENPLTLRNSVDNNLLDNEGLSPNSVPYDARFGK